MADHRGLWRWTGIAALIGTMAWTVANVLLLGGHATPADYPLLLDTHATRIGFDALPLLLPSSDSRSSVGTLSSDIAAPLALAGSVFVYLGAERTRPLWRFLLAALFAAGLS